MKNGRGALTALHLLLVWVAMTVVVPLLGFGLLLLGWGGGAGATVPVFAVGVPLAVGLLAVTGMPVRTVVPLCGSVPRRLVWAALVFVLGTLGVLAGMAVYGQEVYLGSAEARFALVGVPYAVAAAFFVPGLRVRLGALVVLASAVAYGGFIGPEQARQNRHEVDVARYRERAELLYLGAAPQGMRVSRAEVRPGSFVVDYGSVREGYEPGHVGLSVRPPLSPVPQCPGLAPAGETCTLDARGEMRTVRDFPDGGRSVTLARRHRGEEVVVSSETVDEAGLRGVLDTLHPLSDAELEALMRETRIDYRI